MALSFRNIDATPADPVEMWGFEGMLAAIDRGYARDWRKLVSAVMENPQLHDEFAEARDAAESRSTVALIDIMLEHARMTAPERALERLLDAYYGTRMTQAGLGKALGTSRTRVNSYLTGKVTPSMNVLVAVEELAERYRSLAHAPELELY